MTEDLCLYCNASHQRLQLAEALESGRYQQFRKADRHTGLLRDPQDRYSVTGVATLEIAPIVWVRTPETWAVYSLESFAHAFPKTTGIQPQYPDPDDDFIETLMEIAGTGTSIGCPEETACALGLHEHDNSTHPDTIEVNAQLLTQRERQIYGIPVDWDHPYPLDLLDFKDAALLIRRHAKALIGHCTFGDQQEDEE